MKRCLFCYHPLTENELDYHQPCARKIFGQPIAPELPYSENDLIPLAEKLIQSQTAVTGVQPKLSLHLSTTKNTTKEKRFTIVGLWGGYILKTPSASYQELPEVEDLTMHLASLAGIKTATHSLIRLSSGKLAYVTKRMDRVKKNKLAMEDMCQLTERLTEDKYQGSYEQIGKAVQKYSATPGLDLINFFELILFSYLTGNTDMHLKNFSLLEQPALGMRLSPAYDLINTKLVNPVDDEEMALTLNGKKKKLKKQDFIAAMKNLGIEEKQQFNIFNKMHKALPKWLEMINISFMGAAFKKEYRNIVVERANQVLIKNYALK